MNVGAIADVALRIQALAERTAELAGRPRPAGAPRVDERYTAAGYGATDRRIEQVRLYPAPS